MSQYEKKYWLRLPFHCNFKNITPISKGTWLLSKYLIAISMLMPNSISHTICVKVLWVSNFNQTPSIQNSAFQPMSTNLMSAIPNRLILADYTDYRCHRDRCNLSGHQFQWYLSSRRQLMCGISSLQKNILSTIKKQPVMMTNVNVPARVQHNALVNIFVNISWLWMWSDVLLILWTKNLNSHDFSTFLVRLRIILQFCLTEKSEELCLTI